MAGKDLDFDSLVQNSTGFGFTDAQAYQAFEDETKGDLMPKPLPCQAVDHAAGYLLAFGISAALCKTITEGGSWEVRVSLAGVAQWIRSFGQLDPKIAFRPDLALPTGALPWPEELVKYSTKIRQARPDDYSEDTTQDSDAHSPCRMTAIGHTAKQSITPTMGQINSTTNTSRSERESRTAAGQSSTNTAVPDLNPAPPGAQTNAGRHARRTSIRNSITRFVRPKTSGTVGHDASRIGSESRRLWRWSIAGRTRRTEPQNILSVEHGLSSAPLQGNVSSHTRSQTNSSRHPTNNSDSSSSQVNQTTSSSTTEARDSNVVQALDSNPATSPKGKERSSETSNKTTDDSTSVSLQTRDNAHSTDLVDQSASSSNSAALPSTIVNGSSPVSSSSTPIPPTLPTSQSSSINSPLRRSPPVGTLVVVQGVVRTDSPLALAQGRPPSSTGRGQYSADPALIREQSGSDAVLQNPSSGRAINEALESHQGSRPSTSGSGDAPGASGSQLFESQPTSSSASSGETSNSSTSRESTSGSASADVLGALLSIVSVATAATAASLLTSSNGQATSSAPSELSSLPSDTSQSIPPEGPNIPLIARALASANPAAAAVLAQREREREERERNRTRSIWEGLRERVISGRSRNASGIGSRSQSSAFLFIEVWPNITSLVLDSLFNELVRAFSMGPTQDEHQMDTQSSSSGRTSSDEDQVTSPHEHSAASEDSEDLAPGSFERFLVDLQSDLRLALIRPDATSSVTSARPADHHEGEDSGTFPGNSHALSLASEPMSHGSEGTAGPSVTYPSPHHESSDSEDHNPDDRTNQSIPSMPGEYRENIHDDMPNGGGTSVPVSFPTSRTEETQSSPTSDRSETPSDPPTSIHDASRNRVNWWRMYRFPPTPSVRSTRYNAGQDSSHINTPTSSTSAPAEPINAGTAESSSQSAAMAQDTPVLGEEPAVLIPVIVVGLQSISSGTRRAQPETPEPPTENNNDPGEGHRTNVSQSGNSSSSGAAQRARDTWSSRAARAFNRLGRRDITADQTTDTSNAADGARTFFIYVFGGHYPPDHQLLSSPDETDSFEALWELADFLGQVKPPVVTEEEIERSGLELFKAAALKYYASSRRVASNCLDRCLICLDDYNPDDELRLLSCKHAFHKAE
ncbi:hypothetical protein A7U60_g8733 [Sanghuangporus baumii]|uniref:RING-type domain-containing protein n=1 Tax=Sanghuangporus baumii TaxID=108892 RepID=A0A9Q5MXP6_SANBA|nr:hypothetical protein A7U60_g8733 [Sanghuangporus baumii]